MLSKVTGVYWLDKIEVIDGKIRMTMVFERDAISVIEDCTNMIRCWLEGDVAPNVVEAVSTIVNFPGVV